MTERDQGGQGMRSLEESTEHIDDDNDDDDNDDPKAMTVIY